MSDKEADQIPQGIPALAAVLANHRQRDQMLFASGGGKVLWAISFKNEKIKLVWELVQTICHAKGYVTIADLARDPISLRADWGVDFDQVPSTTTLLKYISEFVDAGLMDRYQEGGRGAYRFVLLEENE